MERDYIGKTVYVGIDVHKNSYSVCCISEGNLVKKWNMQAFSDRLIQQLLKYFPQATIKSAYEAGFSGNTLHRKLCEAGIDNIVINPGSLETATRDRVKTDRRDAKKIAEQLSYNKLTCVYIPDEEEELQRELTRLRERFIKERARTANRIKSKLLQYGYWGCGDTRIVSKKLIESLRATDFPKGLDYILEEYIEIWLEFCDRIKALDKKIREMSEAHPEIKARELIYKSIPGLGEISAQEFSRELGDMRQFSSLKKLYSYTGLTPSESSSGEHRRLGGITRCGRSRLRHLLVEIAWRNVSKDKELNEKFIALSARRGKKRAIVAIARHIIGRMRCCVLEGRLYDYTPLTSS